MTNAPVALDFLIVFWVLVYLFFAMGMFKMQTKAARLRYGKGMKLDDVDIFYEFVLIPLISAVIWPVMIFVKASVLSARRSMEKDAKDEV